jgi:tetratricopeptide (TPR) repeat protein
MNLMALSQSNIGTIHQEKGELEEALRWFEQSLVYRAAMVESHPSVTEYQAKLGFICRQISTIQQKTHRDAQAFLSIQRSIDVLKSLVRAQPDQAGFHSELGLSWNFLGVLYDEARKNTEALAAFEQAVAEQQLAVDRAKEPDEYRAFLANHLDNLGEQFVDLGRVAEGLPIYRHSLQIFRELNAAYPGNRYYSLEVLRSLIRQGTIERHDGDPAAARQSFSAARTLLERWSGAAPGDGALRILLGAALDQEANALFDLGLVEEAQQRLEHALTVLPLSSNHPPSDHESGEQRRFRSEVLNVLGLVPDAGEAGVDQALRWRSEALWDLARVLRARNLVAAAAAADGERAALWKEHPPGELVGLALEQLDRILVIGYGKTPGTERGRAVRELDLAEAARNVRLAIARGFKDLRKLRSHPASSVLLSREELKLLIMDLDFPDRPFAAP